MTSRNEIINDAATFLTAHGMNDAEDALEYWENGPEENMAEAIANDWYPQGDWSLYWDEIREAVISY